MFGLMLLLVYFKRNYLSLRQSAISVDPLVYEPCHGEEEEEEEEKKKKKKVKKKKKKEEEEKKKKKH